jgi:hypothetical protein
MLKFDYEFEFDPANMKYLVFHMAGGPKSGRKSKKSGESGAKSAPKSEKKAKKLGKSGPKSAAKSGPKPADIVTYSVPYFGITAKIIDFDFSSIPEEDIYNAVSSNPRVAINYIENDLIRLFHLIYELARRERAYTGKGIETLLTSLDPTRSYMNAYAPQIRRIDTPSVEDMLGNKVFDDYKCRVKSGQIYAEFAVST